MPYTILYKLCTKPKIKIYKLRPKPETLHVARVCQQTKTAKQVNPENLNHEGLLQATMTNQQTIHKELYKDELPWDNQGLPVSRNSTKPCTSCEGTRYCHL